MGLFVCGKDPADYLDAANIVKISHKSSRYIKLDVISSVCEYLLFLYFCALLCNLIKVLLMKKIYLLALIISFVVVGSAQILLKGQTQQLWQKTTPFKVMKFNANNRSYNEKLDSVVINLMGEKIIFFYDEDWNVTRMSEIFQWASQTVVYNRDYTYDESGNVIYMIESGLDDRKTEYLYEEDMLFSETEYDLENGIWVPDEKIEYYHSEDETLGQEFHYVMEDSGEWRLDEKTEYVIQGEKVISAHHYHMWVGDTDWTYDAKKELTYDANDNPISVISYNIFGNFEEEYQWIPDEKELYTYDNNNNCDKVEVYEWDSEWEIWEIEATTINTYDLNSNVSNIAGFGLFAEEEIFTITNKMTYSSVSTGDAVYLATFYYSGITGITDNNDDNINIWPNPVTETINIQTENYKVAEIFSVDGRLVKSFTENDNILNVSNLNSGYYILKITLMDGSVATQKFVKR